MTEGLIANLDAKQSSSFGHSTCAQWYLGIAVSLSLSKIDLTATDNASSDLLKARPAAIDLRL